MTGDMEVTRLTALKGLSIRQTHGFCHFFPVKSEAIPTQQQKATTDSISGRAKNKKHQYSFLRLYLLQILSTIRILNYFSQFKSKSRKIQLGFYQNRSPMTFQ